MRRSSNDTTARKINAIRATAGNDGSVCCTCGQPADDPARRIVRGVIIEGCVDATHHGRLVSPSGSADWHNRKVAQGIRKATLQALTSL